MSLPALTGDKKKQKKRLVQTFLWKEKLCTIFLKKNEIIFIPENRKSYGLFYVYCFHCQLVKICLCNKIPTMENL